MNCEGWLDELLTSCLSLVIDMCAVSKSQVACHVNCSCLLAIIAYWEC